MSNKLADAMATLIRLPSAQRGGAGDRPRPASRGIDREPAAADRSLWTNLVRTANEVRNSGASGGGGVTYDSMVGVPPRNTLLTESQSGREMRCGSQRSCGPGSRRPDLVLVAVSDTKPDRDANPGGVAVHP